MLSADFSPHGEPFQSHRIGSRGMQADGGQVEMVLESVSLETRRELGVSIREMLALLECDAK